MQPKQCLTIILLFQHFTGTAEFWQLKNILNWNFYWESGDLLNAAFDENIFGQHGITNESAMSNFRHKHHPLMVV